MIPPRDSGPIEGKTGLLKSAKRQNSGVVDTSQPCQIATARSAVAERITGGGPGAETRLKDLLNGSDPLSISTQTDTTACEEDPAHEYSTYVSFPSFLEPSDVGSTAPTGATKSGASTWKHLR